MGLKPYSYLLREHEVGDRESLLTNLPIITDIQVYLYVWYYVMYSII